MQGRGDRRVVIAAAATAAVLGVVALGALGSRAIDVPEDKVADGGAVLQRFAIGAGAAALGCVLVLALLLLVQRRRPEAAAALGVPAGANFGRLLRRSLAVLVIVVAAGGVLGAATAPLRDRTPSGDADRASGTGGGSGSPPRAGGTNRLPGDPSRDVTGNVIPADATIVRGAIVRDRFGREQLSADLDGDGHLDATLVPCPRGRSGTNVRPPSGTGAVFVPVDENCDGTIDAWVRLDSLTPIDPGDAPLDDLQGGLNRGPGTAPAAEDDSVADRVNGSGFSAKLVLLVLAGIAVLGLAGFALHRLLRDPVDDPAPDPVTNEPPDPAAFVQSSLGILGRSDDPRQGIIDAYTELLGGLAAAGLPRLGHEAPGEYVRRCSASLRVRHEPLADLSSLFSVARFSSHQLTAEHLVAARQALHAVAADLAALRADAHAAPEAGGVGAGVGP